MKNAVLFLTAVIMMSLLFACSSAPTQKIDEGSDWEEVSDPMRPLADLARNIVEDGGVAAFAEGRSTRRDLAREKAKANAEGALAEVFEKKVDRLKKNFQEEVGQGRVSEVNELFSVATKSLTSKVLVGAYEKDYKILQNKDGEYLFGVVVAITAKSANNTLLDELASKPELYQRFRASQAFEELQKEIEKSENK
ncbi:MAG: hypothetical protein KKD86_15530 [Bacteroidetes bacterium]|nr:hypothetical protein [Bacteroidota bacterium]